MATYTCKMTNVRAVLSTERMFRSYLCSGAERVPVRCLFKSSVSDCVRFLPVALRLLYQCMVARSWSQSRVYR